MKTYPHIVPSLLAANFAKLNEDLDAMKTNGISMIHFDVMDGWSFCSQYFLWGTRFKVIISVIHTFI